MEDDNPNPCNECIVRACCKKDMTAYCEKYNFYIIKTVVTRWEDAAQKALRDKIKSELEVYDEKKDKKGVPVNGDVQKSFNN